VDGLNAYQTVPPGRPHPGVGSPGSVFAAETSTAALNGTPAIACAFENASFGGAGISATVSCTAPPDVNWFPARM
jgi:hypothetical protein